MAPKSGEDGARAAHFTYVWAIENFSTLTLRSLLRSPPFIVQAFNMTKWHLEAKFHGIEKHLKVYICRETGGSSAMFEIDFEIALFGTNDFRLTYESGASQFQQLGISRCGIAFDEQEFCEHFPNETLTIRCRMWRKGKDESTFDLCFARTHLRVEQQSFVWAIKGFSSLRPGQYKTIFLDPNFESLPILILTFSLRKKDAKEYGHITVHINQPREIHSIDVKIRLLDGEGYSVESTTKVLSARITPKQKKVCEFSEFFERVEIMSNSAKYLVNDVLSLKCKFDISAGPLWSRIENYRQLESSGVEAFASDISVEHFDSNAKDFCPFKGIFKSLYEDGTLSDICLKAGSQSFNVHKVVLGARSPVFKAMFTKDMREKTAKCVDIPDLSTETLRRLLLYIYTNRVEKLGWEEASDLFRAADKYELLDLREKCSYILKAHLSASNAYEILVLAEMHYEEDLSKAVRDFTSQDSDVLISEEWKYLTRTD